MEDSPGENLLKFFQEGEADFQAIVLKPECQMKIWFQISEATAWYSVKNSTRDNIGAAW